MMNRVQLAALLPMVFLLPACGQVSEPTKEPTTPRNTSITALGRLEPGLGVVEVGAPVGDRVHSVEVREGDSVRTGQTLVVLESHQLRRAEVELAEAAYAEAESELRRSKRVGPVTIETREATVLRLEADLRLSTSDLDRTRRLVETEVLPSRELDFQLSVSDQAQARLVEAKKQLEEETRRTRFSIASAEASLARAEAEVRTAESRLERTLLRSPIDGVVLDLRLLPGEATARGPILTLGEVSEMMAIAEIFETDARFIRAGLRAEVTSPALAKPLTGKVETMGRLIRRNDVLSLDPAARTDVRVIEARIRLDDPRAAAAFVHLQVDVRIETQASG